MTDLLCPYCDQVRPSRSRLQLHVDNVHRYQASPGARTDAVRKARTVEDVASGPVDPFTEPPTVQERIDAAGKDIAHLAGQIDDVIRRVEALDAPDPARVRRTALYDVAEMLGKSGQYAAYHKVMDMIQKEAQS